MGRKTLGYEDAVKILGGESKVVRALGRLAGAGLTAATAGGSDLALGLFDLKGEVERLAQDAVTAVQARARGLSRYSRSELLEAAHSVIVVGAFFSALDDLDRSLLTSLNTATLEVTSAQQSALATDLPVRDIRLADLVENLNSAGLPGLAGGTEQQPLLRYYGKLATMLLGFVPGTAIWDHVDETRRERWKDAMAKDLPRSALVRYEQWLRRLATDYPEMAFCAQRVGVRVLLDELKRTRQEVSEHGTSLAGLAQMVQWMTSGRTPDELRTALATEYRAQVDTPLADPDAVPEGVRLPTLREIYVNPSYRRLRRLGRSPEQPEQISESAWNDAAADDDLETFLVQYLVSPEAAAAPLVILGQPGAGKSLLTQMLAVRLPPEDYLVIRVELRNVSADAGIQQQIEEALYGLTQREHSWPSIAGSCAPALPLLILDGFDELLQASNSSHFDYLEKVQEFQEYAARHGHPTAVIVTSRTAVADQVRYPRESAVIRLEEFDDARVGRWIECWRKANPVGSLTAEAALAQEEIARQPLLLFMLALFYADGGRLQEQIGRTELYESLFTRFAEREVAKRHQNSDERKRDALVAKELYLMSLVAFSMFNRGAQGVTDEELAKDLEALRLGEQEGRQNSALDMAQELAGRFFFKLFVHRSQAVDGVSLRRRYEFLHASFGEFLVGRCIAAELQRMAKRAIDDADDPIPAAPDDSRLRTLASFAALSDRVRVVEVVSDRITALAADERAELRSLLIRLFREQPDSRPPELLTPVYEPVKLGIAARFAVYSANLCILLVQAASATDTPMVSLSELYPHVDPVTARNRFTSATRSWYAHLTSWASLLRIVRVDESSDPVTIRAWPRQLFDGVDAIASRSLLNMFLSDFSIIPGSIIGASMREAAVINSDTCRYLLFSLEPVLKAAAPTSLHLHETLEVALPSSAHKQPNHTYAYDRIINDSLKGLLSIDQKRIVLTSLKMEQTVVKREAMQRHRPTLLAYGYANVLALLDIVEEITPSDANMPPLATVLYDDPLSSMGMEMWDQVLGIPNADLPFTEQRDLRVLLMLSDLFGLEHPSQIQDLIHLLTLRAGSIAGELLGTVYWAAAVARGIHAPEPPSTTLTREETEVINSLVPGYLAEISDLATGRGHPDPLVII